MKAYIQHENGNILKSLYINNGSFIPKSNDSIYFDNYKAIVLNIKWTIGSDLNDFESVTIVVDPVFNTVNKTYVHEV